MTKKYTLKEFIDKANIIHKNKYDYSKTKYVDSHTPVIIICPIHKEFIQSPHKHLVGHGCPKCAKNGIKYDENDLIEKFNLVHKNKYDYSNVEYKNAHTKIKIICPIHGEFFQAPYSHLQGHGCPMCKESIGEIIINEFLSENNLILNKDYFREYKFDNCRDEFKLPFDFYIKTKNICIEFQGMQHYTTDFWRYMKNIPYSPIERLKYIQKHDDIKRKYCNDNNIKLIIIDSRMFSKNNKIDKKLLKKYLKMEIFND